MNISPGGLRRHGPEPLEQRMLLAIGDVVALAADAAPAAKDDALVIDHNDTDLTALSQTAISNAKDKLHIAYGHTSHGAQLTDGMTDLVDFINGGGLGGLPYSGDSLRWNDGGTGGALDLHDLYRYFRPEYVDLGMPDYSTWATKTREYLDDPAHGDVNVFVWAWSYNLNTAEQNVSLYLDLMSQLEIDYPDVQFVYMTGWTNGKSTTSNLFLRNEQIRDYAVANNKTLYDYADIESWDPDGNYYGDRRINEDGSYDSDGDGLRDRNWMLEWQDSHQEGVDWYLVGDAGPDELVRHTRHINVNRKAYAAWALWTEIAARMVEQPVEVVGHHVFYNDSAFDGNDPATNPQDDEAIAPDKASLLPGQTATFANYTSYARGINGIMVDVANLPDGAVPTADDFQFRTGNSDDPDSWTAVAATPTVSIRPVVGDTSRITIIWPDNAIEKQWLQVTVYPGGTIALPEADVFYFGNAIGELGNSTTEAKVNAIDMLGARDNQRNFFDPAPIDFVYDFDRNARVNGTDMLIARNNQTHFLNALRLITVPAVKVDRQDTGESRLDALQDAALRQLGLGAPDNQETSADSLSWLYELDQASAHGQLPSGDGKDRPLAGLLPAGYGQ